LAGESHSGGVFDLRIIAQNEWVNVISKKVSLDEENRAEDDLDASSAEKSSNMPHFLTLSRVLETR
jgi:hypothetical protein